MMILFNSHRETVRIGHIVTYCIQRHHPQYLLGVAIYVSRALSSKMHSLDQIRVTITRPLLAHVDSLLYKKSPLCATFVLRACQIHYLLAEAVVAAVNETTSVAF